MRAVLQFELTSELRGSVFVEGERNRIRACAALRRNRQPSSTPAGGNNATSRHIGRQQRSITPRQVDGADRHSRVLVELFRKSSVRWRVLGNDGDEAVRKGLD